MHDVIGMWTDTAQNSKYSLHEERGRDEFTIKKMREILEMRGIITFIFEFCACILQCGEHKLDVFECVAEHEIA